MLYTAFRRDSNDVVTPWTRAMERRSGFAYPAPFKNEYSDGVGPGPYAMPQVIRRPGFDCQRYRADPLLEQIGRQAGVVAGPLQGFWWVRLKFGYSSHALPYKDSLIVLAGGSKQRCHEGQTERWRRCMSNHRLDSAHSSPLLINVDGQQQVALLLAKEIVGIDPETGELLWRHPHPTEYGLAVQHASLGRGNLRLCPRPTMEVPAR